MEKLKNDWLTDGLIDFEYKKYVLLAYLQHVRKSFREMKLYPVFDDLIFHYKNLITLRDTKKLLYEQFPKEITEADFQRLTLNYRRILEDDAIMRELEEICEYAIPVIKTHLEEGKEVYEIVSRNLEITPVGITPIYKYEGYMMMREAHKPQTIVYRYKISIFKNANERFRGINITKVEEQRSKFQTPETIKANLIKRYPEMPNPATYLITTTVACAYEQTFMPIAKRSLVRYITANE
ncbi:MAG: hypothetical protein NZM38_09775 [Cytophagales bacterium]|nr:hypothetical protein [Cytophagales bacterium]MDW8385045.1 hypothetical protein [Flammeovirgaceae bacterium]